MDTKNINITRKSIKNNIFNFGFQDYPFTNVSSLGGFLYDNYICNPINILFLPWHIIKFIWYITFYNIYYRLDNDIKKSIAIFFYDLVYYFKNNMYILVFICVISIVIITVILIINSYTSKKDILLKNYLLNSNILSSIKHIREHPKWNDWKNHKIKDFYINSSSYSWLLNDKYCSKDAIKYLLQDYGVRFLELEIMKSSIYSNIPIVASGIEEGQWIISHNIDLLSGIDRSGFTFNECCNTINLYGFTKTKNNNPLFIKLILKNGSDNMVLDKIADILNFYFNNKLLSNLENRYKFASSQNEIPNIKIRDLLDTVIIISNNRAKSSSKLYELVNINIDEPNSTFHPEIYEDFKNTENLNDILNDNKCDNNLCFRNKTNLSHIRMDFDKNYDPSMLWYQGYQLVGMNFSIQDKHIKTNSDFFKYYITFDDNNKIIQNSPGGSILLKPDILLENPSYVSIPKDSIGEPATQISLNTNINGLNLLSN